MIRAKVWAVLVTLAWVVVAGAGAGWVAMRFHDPDLQLLMAMVLGWAVGLGGLGVYAVTRDWRERREYIRASNVHRIGSDFHVEWWAEVWRQHLRERHRPALIVPTDRPREEEE